MKKFIDWRMALTGIAIAAVSGFGVNWLFGLPFWAGFLLVAFGMVANGIIAEIEDDGPGGFNDPN